MEKVRNANSFEVFVSKDTFKFNAAHFVAFPGFRERLHGHNYRVSVRLVGSRKIGVDGYLIDFGEVKGVTKNVCKSLNEYFICPMYSPVLKITTDADDVKNPSVRLECEDGAVFTFPRQDVTMLPLAHATAEELAIYLYGEILKGLDSSYLSMRGIHTMEVIVAEAPGQEATFRHEINDFIDGGNVTLDVRKFIMDGDVIPAPCPENSKQNNLFLNGGCPSSCCQTKTNFAGNFEDVLKAINERDHDLTGDELKTLLGI